MSQLGIYGLNEQDQLNYMVKVDSETFLHNVVLRRTPEYNLFWQYISQLKPGFTTPLKYQRLADLNARPDWTFLAYHPYTRKDVMICVELDPRLHARADPESELRRTKKITKKYKKEFGTEVIFIRLGEQVYPKGLRSFEDRLEQFKHLAMLLTSLFFIRTNLNGSIQCQFLYDKPFKEFNIIYVEYGQPTVINKHIWRSERDIDVGCSYLGNSLPFNSTNFWDVWKFRDDIRPLTIRDDLERKLRRSRKPPEYFDIKYPHFVRKRRGKYYGIVLD
tara:strand:- start:7325 stop:8152 length:828 start_codon:yes stop_codon:yes gene_type:complete